jgi:transposase
MLGPVKTCDLARPVLVSLEALVPKDNVYRQLDKMLDLSFVRNWVKDCYAEGGRPSIDPVVFFKLELVLYLEGLRSERQLMRLAADRLSVRWFLGYGLDEALPDHSTLTRIRERYGLEVFRRFFGAIVEQCIEAGLVWGKELYFDATKVEANASLDSVKPRFAVDEHLRNLFAVEEDDEEPDDEPGEQEQGADGPMLVQLPVDPPSDLADRNSRRHDWIARGGRPQRDVRRHGYHRIADYQMSTTDPDAASMRTADGVLHLGYQDTYVTDGGRARIILNVLVTPGEVMENQPMLDLLWHTCFRWQLRPDQVTADTTPMAPLKTSFPSKMPTSRPIFPCLIGTSAPRTLAPRSSPTIPTPIPISVPMGECCGARPPSTPRAGSSIERTSVSVMPVPSRPGAP